MTMTLKPDPIEKKRVRLKANHIFTATIKDYRVSIGTWSGDSKLPYRLEIDGSHIGNCRTFPAALNKAKKEIVRMGS